MNHSIRPPSCHVSPPAPMRDRGLALVLQLGQFIGQGEGPWCRSVPDCGFVVMKKRRRAECSGTAGCKIGWTLMPRSNRARARQRLLTELPTIHRNHWSAGGRSGVQPSLPGQVQEQCRQLAQPGKRAAAELAARSTPPAPPPRWAGTCPRCIRIRGPCTLGTRSARPTRRCIRRNWPATWESVPIHRSTSVRAIPKCSPMPRPVGPMVAQRECASSTSSNALCFFLSSTKRGRSGIVAVHAVHTLDGDEHAAIALTHLGQKGRRSPASYYGRRRVGWLRKAGPPG